MEKSLKKIFNKTIFIYLIMLLFAIGLVAFVINLKFFKPPIYVKDIEILVPKRGTIYTHSGQILACSIRQYDFIIDLNIKKMLDLKNNNKLIYDKYIDSLIIVCKKVFPNENFSKVIKQQINDPSNHYQLLKRYVSYFQRKEIMEFHDNFYINNFSEWRNKRSNPSGPLYSYPFRFDPYFIRCYPENNSAKRTIGSYASDSVHFYDFDEKLLKKINYIDSIKTKPILKGTTGLEKYYDDVLRGESGLYRIKPVASGDGKKIVYQPTDAGEYKKLEDGADIYSTIDLSIQNIVDYALEKQIRKCNAQWGTAIVMEVKTGKIRAISNLERNYRKDSVIKYVEKNNFAAGGMSGNKNAHFPDPGSTFKLATMIVALENGLDPNLIINCGDGKEVFFPGEKPVVDTKDGGYGSISAKHVFEVSSNIGITRIVVDMFGKNKMAFINGLNKLHLNTALNIEIPGATKPVIKNENSTLTLKDGTIKTDWYASSYTNIAIGYELQINPFQLLILYNAVANNGTMVNPIFVDSIVKNGKTIEIKKTKILEHRICNKNTLETIKEMLVGVVDNGTARAIKSDYYKIAGKTGTAQTNYFSRAENESMKYYCSFAGYFPADNPQYTVFVGVYHPERGAKSGSAVAAPVFKEISDRIITKNPDYYYLFDKEKQQIPTANKGYIDETNIVYKYFNIPTNINEIESGKCGFTDVINGKITFKPVNYNNLTVIPDLYGMCVNDAVALLENAGLDVEISGFGVVREQSIKKGEKLIKGATIKLTLRQ